MYSLLIKKNNIELEVSANREFIERQFQEFLDRFMISNADFTLNQKDEKTLEIHCESDYVDSPQDIEAPGVQAQNFDDFYARVKVKTPLDTLISVAFYLKNNKNIHNFALKDINREVFHITGQVIDHAVVNEAVGKSMLVPFLSDEATEYALTFIGEEYFENELQ